MSSSVETQIETIDYYPDCSEQQIQDVLAIVEKWSARNAPHVVHMRAFPRSELRGLITVIASYIDPHGQDKDAPPLRLALHVPAQNISQCGIGLIAPPQFVPHLISDATPFMKTAEVFREGVRLTIHLDRSGTPPLVIDGTVVRVQPTHQGFFDLGLKFVERKAAAADVETS